MKKLFFPLFVLAFFPSCEEEETETKNIDKSGSIEIVLSTKHMGGKDVFTLNRTFWANGIKQKEDFIIDTLQALPTIKEVGEDENGNEKELNVQKEYQFFITIK